MSNIITTERPPIVLGVGVRGRFKFIRRRGDESIVEETPFGKNMWLDQGLDYLCGHDDGLWLNGLVGCHVGAGNTPASSDDVALEIFVAGIGGRFDQSTHLDAAGRFQRETVVFRFPTGSAVGNLSEVGISVGYSSNNPVNGAGRQSAPLATRALITDEGGNPVTISPQPDEILDVVWEFTKYAPHGDVEGQFQQEIDGVSKMFDYVVRPARNTSLGWTSTPDAQLDASNTGNMSRGGSGASTGVVGSPFGTLNPVGETAVEHVNLGNYIQGSFYRDSRLKFDLSRANFNIQSFIFNNSLSAWMMQISPTVEKTSSKEYYIDIRTSVSRYLP